MPRLVRIITQKRLKGSGPKKEAKMPGVFDTAGSSIRARPSSAAMKPPWPFSTAAMTATMPKSMMMPWMKSFTAVAM